MITEEFPQGPISKVDDRKLNADLDAYTRLTNNIYFNKYPRKYPNSSVTELDREKLRVATSTEGMNILSGKEKKVSLNFFSLMLLYSELYKKINKNQLIVYSAVRNKNANLS